MRRVTPDIKTAAKCAAATPRIRFGFETPKERERAVKKREIRARLRRNELLRTIKYTSHTHTRARSVGEMNGIEWTTQRVNDLD